MVNKKFNKQFKLENYDTHFSLCTQKWFLIIVVILTLLLIIKKSNRFQNINNLTVERLLLFFILLLLLFILTRNTIYTLIGTIILFILFNILMIYSNQINQINLEQKNYIESFDNQKAESEEKEGKEGKKELTHEELNTYLTNIDKNIESYQNDKDVKKAASGLQELLKKLNGGIELKKDDLNETKPLGIDTTQFKDEKKNNALQKAQQETYQLIDSVSALKDTITTLSPVLSQGKEIMSLFENLKL
jgi:hypothetical protein